MVGEGWKGGEGMCRLERAGWGKKGLGGSMEEG